MSDEDSAELLETGNAKLETDFVGFALSDCLIQTDPQTEKYLKRVIRTAFELAVYNRFGAEIGGFWLMTEQIEQLRNLPEYYSPLRPSLSRMPSRSIYKRKFTDSISANSNKALPRSNRGGECCWQQDPYKSIASRNPVR